MTRRQLSFNMRSVVIVVLCVLKITECYLFTPSELASKLRTLGVPDWDVPTLVCVAHNASQLKTDYVSHRLDIGYNYYGIFGIPDKLFSHKPCSYLNKQLTLDDSIDDDVSCVMKMVKDGGYLAGNRSTNMGVFTPHDVDLSKCFDWWESLPPYIPTQTNQNQTDKAIESSTTRINNSTPVTYSLQCTSGVTTNLLLLLLNLVLMGICTLGYFILKQLRVNQLVMKFNDQPLL